MDWMQLLTTLIAALVPTGGVVGLFTLREKKTEMTLDNANKINEQWAAFAQKEEDRRAELKADLDKKDGKIDSLHAEIASLREQLDDERTARAKAEMMRCLRVKCTERHPPFGEGYLPEK